MYKELCTEGVGWRLGQSRRSLLQRGCPQKSDRCIQDQVKRQTVPGHFGFGWDAFTVVVSKEPRLFRRGRRR